MATRTTRCRRMGTVGDTSHFHKPELAVKCDPRVSWCEGDEWEKFVLLQDTFSRFAPLSQEYPLTNTHGLWRRQSGMGTMQMWRSHIHRFSSIREKTAVKLQATINLWITPPAHEHVSLFHF